MGSCARKNGGLIPPVFMTVGPGARTDGVGFMAGYARDGAGRGALLRVAEWRRWQGPHSDLSFSRRGAARAAAPFRGWEEAQLLQHLDHAAPELVPSLDSGNVARQHA
jgi:hypothetical protein